MEQNTMTTEDILDESLESALSHHGVKGMHWGVWNAETAARYAGRKLSKAGAVVSAQAKKAGAGIKRMASSASGFAAAKNKERAAKREVKRAEKAKAIAARKVEKAAAKQQRKDDKIKAIEERKVAKQQAKLDAKQQKKELKNQRKEMGMTRSEFVLVRDRTLKSHDPRIVAKGMNTLTDKELEAKIARLEQEEKISKMAFNLDTYESKTRKSKMEAIAANPVVKLGTTFASNALDKAVKGMFEKKPSSDNSKSSSSDDSGSNRSPADQVKFEFQTSRSSDSLGTNTSKYNFGSSKSVSDSAFDSLIKTPVDSDLSSVEAKKFYANNVSSVTLSGSPTSTAEKSRLVEEQYKKLKGKG